jgi:hypothetical protein
MAVSVNCGNGMVKNQLEDTVFTCTYASGGTYTILHSVTDSGGLKNSSATSKVTVANSATYNVSGNLKKQAGTAISYATVKLVLAGVDVKSATTNSLGNFTFTGVAPGSYTVKIIKTGITQTPASVTPAINVVAGSLTGVAVRSVE